MSLSAKLNESMVHNKLCFWGCTKNGMCKAWWRSMDLVAKTHLKRLTCYMDHARGGGGAGPGFVTSSTPPPPEP